MYLLNLWFLPSASHVKHLWEFRLPLHISIRLLSSIKKLHILTSISSFKVILLMSCWQRGSNFSPFGFFLDLFGGLIPLPLGLFIEISNFSIIFGEHFLLLHLLNVVLKCPRLIILNSHIFYFCERYHFEHHFLTLPLRLAVIVPIIITSIKLLIIFNLKSDFSQYSKYIASRNGGKAAQ